ncbi:MAG: IS21 family transposase [Salinivirgaceae bacterium]|jgi:transposase|nr:IS21 family transposase [Salinivirgaceae bacterium]
MGAKTENNMIREIIRLVLENGKSTRECGELLKVSKSTVAEYVQRFKRCTLSLEDLNRLSDQDLELYLCKGSNSENNTQRTLFELFPYVDKELHRTGVTLYILWEEYKLNNPQGISYTRFCHYHRLWKAGRNVSMHQHYKAGEKLFVDFTGKKLPIINRDTGEITEVEVFVAVLGCSHYTYIEAIPSQKKRDFIAANQNTLQFFGGVPKAIVPDCLKSAVIKSDRYEPEINSSYYDFSKHYNTTILPARALKPKDKSLVENMVKTIYTRVFAPLRNMQFFSIEELNEQMWRLLDDHNNMKFQQKETTRKSLFDEVEKESLLPLPTTLYQLRDFQKVRVQYNHHVYLKEDKHYYSVPWEYTGKEILLVYSASLVEIYANHQRIASHKRSLQPYGYTTETKHRPKDHQFKEQFGHKEICDWAVRIGNQTLEYINAMIAARNHPEQAYRSCLGVLSLAKKHDKVNVEKACTMGNQLKTYSSKFIRNTLQNGTYRFFDQKTQDTTKVINIHANIRGKETFK